MPTTFDTGSLGQRIRMTRQDLGITQEELARNFGVTPQHISAIELDRRLPSLGFLAHLAERLGVTTDYLITGKHPSFSDPLAAISTDDSLSNEAKKTLITIIKIFRRANSKP